VDAPEPWGGPAATATATATAATRAPTPPTSPKRKKKEEKVREKAAAAAAPASPPQRARVVEKGAGGLPPVPEGAVASPFRDSALYRSPAKSPERRGKTVAPSPPRENPARRFLNMSPRSTPQPRSPTGARDAPPAAANDVAAFDVASRMSDRTDVVGLTGAVGERVRAALFPARKKHASTHPRLQAAIERRAEMTEVISMLAAHPRGAERVDHKGDLPIHSACKHNADPLVIECLLEANPTGATARDKKGFLPIHLAAGYRAELESVELLVRTFPESVSCMDKRGCLPVTLARTYDAPRDVVEFLASETTDEAMAEEWVARREDATRRRRRKEMRERRRSGGIVGLAVGLARRLGSALGELAGARGTATRRRRRRSGGGVEYRARAPPSPLHAALADRSAEPEDAEVDAEDEDAELEDAAAAPEAGEVLANTAMIVGAFVVGSLAAKARARYFPARWPDEDDARVGRRRVGHSASSYR